MNKTWWVSRVMRALDDAETYVEMDRPELLEALEEIQDDVDTRISALRSELGLDDEEPELNFDDTTDPAIEVKISDDYEGWDSWEGPCGLYGDLSGVDWSRWGGGYFQPTHKVVDDPACDSEIFEGKIVRVEDVRPGAQ